MELELTAVGKCKYCKKVIPLRIYLRGESFRLEGDAVYRYPGGYANLMCYDCKEELEGPFNGKHEIDWKTQAWPKK